MRDDHYNKMIQNNMKSGYNKLLPIAALVLFMASVSIYFSPIPKWFVAVDFSMAVILLFLAIMKEQINIEVKIVVSVLIPIIIGTLSFIDGGVNSSFGQLILVGNLIAAILLSNRKSMFISIVSVLLYIILWVGGTRFLNGENFRLSNSFMFLHFIVFTIFVVFLQVLTRSVRGYLIENIKNLEDSGKKTYNIAFYDQLTGIANQILFKKMLLEKNNKHSGFIILYKIKNMDVINYFYGEKTGNQVLIEVAKAFNNVMKDGDLLGKNSGNEFAFWNEDISENQLMIWFSNINKVLRREDLIYKQNIKLQFYISYAAHKPKENQIDDCYKKANLALIHAKTNNETDIVKYSKTFEEKLYKEEKLREAILDAINQKAFTIYYQTKVDLSSGTIIGVEALARWNSTKFGYVGPDVFVPLIEKINQSASFGELIIDTVLKDYGNICKKYKRNIKVAINISPSHLICNQFIKYLSKKIEEYNIEPDRIIIEITEEVLIQGEERANKVLKAIRKLGVNVSLDDFGSGYSSYNYLMKLDINEIKIDRYFINRMFESSKTIIILESIVYIAKNYHLDLVAEGVETKEQQDKLLDLGCHVMQGYYYAKPEPL